MIINMKKILKILKNNNIDIVLCHGIQSAIIIQIAMFFSKKNINFYYMHRILKHYRSYDFLSRIIYKRFKLILCNSKAVKKSLHAFCDKKKIKVINNAVNSYQSLRFKKGKKNVVSIARLEKRKNILFLIRAFDKFQKKNLNYNLLLVGNGPERKILNDFVNQNKIKNVRFLGYKKNIIKYLNNCRIFVHASLFEGMSNSVLEAMALGRPSVVINSPGVSELHIHNKTGFVSKANINKFANFMDQLANNEHLQKKFFKYSRQRVEKNYSIKKTLLSYNRYLN